MRDILVHAYKCRRPDGEVYRFIIHFNRLKMTSWGRDGINDFPTLFEFIEALEAEVSSTDEKVIAVSPSGLHGPPPNLRARNTELSRHIPADGNFPPGASDGGNRIPLTENEFEAVREALQTTVEDWNQ